MNNNLKSIDAILPPPHFHMVGDGFRVHNFFPSLPKIGLGGMSPFFLPNDGKSLVELIAGEYNGMKGPASTFSPVNLFNA